MLFQLSIMFGSGSKGQPRHGVADAAPLHGDSSRVLTHSLDTKSWDCKLHC